MIERLESLAQEWHEAGRLDFERRSPNINYDTYSPKVVKEKLKYFYLDEGSYGAYMVDKATGNVYRIKSSYGKINVHKCLGHYKAISGETIYLQRWL